MLFASGRADRLTGAALAIAVQAAIIGLLILSQSPHSPVSIAARELIYVFPHAEQGEPKATRPRRTPSSPPGAPSPIAPTRTPPQATILPTPPSQTLRDLGQNLFDCAPENWSRLTQKQRARCPGIVDGLALPDPFGVTPRPNPVKDEAHWAGDYARKEAPPLLPGVTLDKRDIVIWDSSGKPALIDVLK